MLAIARGLMARPQVLMLDEPSLGLAPKLLESLYDLLAAVARRGNDDPARRPDGDNSRSRSRIAPTCCSPARSRTREPRVRSRRIPALVQAYLGGHGPLL